MDEIPSQIITQPPDVLALSPEQPRIEFLPNLWSAAEAFTSSDLETRSEGLNRLISSGSVRAYALVAYLLYSRLTEADIELRTRIVGSLADVLLPREDQTTVNVVTASALVSWLSEMRSRQIWSLLQVAEYDKNSAHSVAALLECCSYAGEHLAEILADRQTPLTIRKQAADYIGRLGYLDALPTLERMVSKLDQRRSNREDYGQTVDDSDECSLLPLIRSALVVLTAP